MQIKQINILDLLTAYNMETCETVLSTFLCPLNKDVEDFIHTKAIDFAIQRIAITFLVFIETDTGPILAGYYALSNKFITLSGNMLSKTLQKKISKFSQYDSHSKYYHISMPLIAQLGKNFSSPLAQHSLTGTHLLTLACNRVSQAQKLIGGKTTYIECNSSTKLYDFYSQNNFYQFGQRENNNANPADNRIFIQMLKYLKD